MENPNTIPLMGSIVPFNCCADAKFIRFSLGSCLCPPLITMQINRIGTFGNVQTQFSNSA
jgi:hypothetical protein